jgi:hypothetical protein
LKSAASALPVPISMKRRSSGDSSEAARRMRSVYLPAGHFSEAVMPV